MTPSRFQVAPPNWFTGQMFPTGPPSMATRLIRPLAWKPTKRLSADQNGMAAPSLPTMG